MTIKWHPHDPEWRWPQLEVVDKYGDFNELTGIIMSKFEEFQCLLIGCYYLMYNIDSKKKNGTSNKDQFLRNLEQFMENSKSKEDYTIDGDGMCYVTYVIVFFFSLGFVVFVFFESWVFYFLRFVFCDLFYYLVLNWSVVLFLLLRCFVLFCLFSFLYFLIWFLLSLLFFFLFFLVCF